MEDSDAPPTLVVVAPTEVDEGDDVNYNLTLSNASAKDISFSYNVSGVSAEDVATTSGTVNISAGETTASITIQTLTDNLIEPTEVLSVSFDDANNIQLGSSSYKTLVNNTTVAHISVADASVDESAGAANVNVSLNAVPVASIEVD